MIKFIARLLLLTIVVASCFASAGCTLFKNTPEWRSINSSFMVTIKGVEQQETIDFEIARSYYLDIKLFGNVEVDDETYKDIQIEYSQENAVITFGYDSPRSNEIRFYVYLYELGSDDKLTITYKGKTVEVGYNVVDYDFEAHGYIAPASLGDLDKYPEFKEMLLSMKYHEFQPPYCGLESYSYSTYWDEGTWYYNLSSKNDTGYLKYLTDSVYYPASFDLVEENPIASREAYMKFRGQDKVMEGAERSIMDYFAVSYGVIDPGCTHPEHPLRSMSFSARNKDMYMYAYDGQYPNAETILLTKYPEKFFQYRMDDITIYILSTENSGARAYFVHGDYFYSLYASYTYD